MKKILVTILVVTMMVGVVFADDVIELFKIDDFQQSAVTNSIDLESARLTLENKVLEEENLEIEVVNADKMGGDRVTFIKNRTIVESDTLIAAKDVKLAEMTLVKKEADLKDDVYKKSLEYLLLEDRISLNTQMLENENKYLENIQTKYDRGLATTTDLTNQKITVSNQEFKLVELNASLESLKYNLNHLIGAPLENDLNLDDIITILPYSPVDIDQVYEERSATYPDIYEKTVLLESTTIIFGLNESRYLETNKEYKTALYNMQIAEINLMDAKKNYEVSLKSKYNAYINNYEAYILKNKQLQLEEKLLSDTLVKKDLGLATDEEVLKAKASVLQAEYNLLEAKYNFNISKVDFDAYY